MEGRSTMTGAGMRSTRIDLDLLPQMIELLGAEEVTVGQRTEDEIGPLVDIHLSASAVERLRQAESPRAHIYLSGNFLMIGTTAWPMRYTRHKA